VCLIERIVWIKFVSCGRFLSKGEFFLKWVWIILCLCLLSLTGFLSFLGGHKGFLNCVGLVSIKDLSLELVNFR